MLKKTNNGIIAVIVTYNPDSEIVDNITALAPQVQEIVVVDNNSELGNRGWMDFCLKNDINVILNPTNLGIAKALNIGAEYGCEKGYSYLLTMDQDSRLEEGAVNKLLVALEKDEKLGSVGVNYNNIAATGLIYKNLLITSGNLTKMSIYKKSGGFNNDLFIDCVDFDFSLKVADLGYKLAIVAEAKMRHRLGEKKTVKCGLFKKTISEHSPIRYYYMYRNHKYIIYRYRKRYPWLCLKKSLIMIKHTIEVILWHSDKKAKLCEMKRGKKDSSKLIQKELLAEKKTK